MRITLLAGGIGGARFTRGLLDHLAAQEPDAEVTVIANTGDDIRLFGLQICPDLDTVMYTLGGGISVERGWGREDETFTIKAELAAYGVQPDWFGLGDRDTATHLVRSQMLAAGYSLSAVTTALCDRWNPGVRLLPMTDDRVETHVVVDAEEVGTRRAIHFQEWWIKHRATLPAHDFVLVGADAAKPAPGVIEAILDADIVLLPPSNPVVSIGTILGIAGIREALAATAAPVVGVSPIVGGTPVRGMADACLTAIGVDVTAEAVARHYGARKPLHTSNAPRPPDADLPHPPDADHDLPHTPTAGILDGWLVHDASDQSAVGPLTASGITTKAVPLLMLTPQATTALAATALHLALTLDT